MVEICDEFPFSGLVRFLDLDDADGFTPQDDGELQGFAFGDDGGYWIQRPVAHLRIDKRICC